MTLRSRPLAFAIVGVLALYLAQYLAVSNTGVTIYQPLSDTLPYSAFYAYIPLPRPFVLSIYPVFRALKFPLQQFLVFADRQAPGHWARWSFEFLTPFGNATEAAQKNNHFFIAAINTFVWLLALRLSLGLYHILNRRIRTHSGA
ncbi:MAG: hypothetical protein U0529_14310 [Thermoanaerobaculia bacterium]